MLAGPAGLSRRAVLSAAAAVPAAALLAACRRGGGDRVAAGVEPVRVLTGLGFQGREAYLDLAAENGWFTEAGLQVELLPGEGTGQNLTLLESGQCEFATLDISAAIIEYATGEFTGFTLTSVLHELNLSCVIALASSGITTPRDLEGKTIAVIPGGINTVAFPALGQLAGFNPDLVEQVALPPPSFGAALAEGRVDAIMQFVVGRHTIEQATGGQDLVVMSYSDWLPDMYGSGIATTVELARTRPDLVRRFNQAALRGLEHAVANPQQAGEIFAARHEGQDPVAAAAEVQALAPYVRPTTTERLQLGELSQIRLAQNIALLEGLGAIPAGITPADVATFGLAR
jgi:NitT/TauT family transport system substrate-binding protein